MTNQELNTRLYEKMFEEQKQYRDWLLNCSPNEILYHSYEYRVREDILLSLEYHDLSNEQCEALLNSVTPLADIFKEFEKLETDYMENIFSAVRNRANTIIALNIFSKNFAAKISI